MVVDDWMVPGSDELWRGIKRLPQKIMTDERNQIQQWPDDLIWEFENFESGPCIILRGAIHILHVGWNIIPKNPNGTEP